MLYFKDRNADHVKSPSCKGCEVYQHQQQRCARGGEKAAGAYHKGGNKGAGQDVESEMTDNRDFYLRFISIQNQKMIL